jgi:hypothetical protein
VEVFLSILRICELISCITGFIYWKKIRTSYLKWFPVFLLFIVLSECIGISFRPPIYLQVNFVYFNYFEIPVEFLFFFWLFYNASALEKNKKLPLICAGLYLLGWITDMVYFSKLEFSSISYTFGNLLLLIVILRYFIALAASNRILTFWNDSLFWICAGLLIYYLGTFPYYGLRKTFCAHYQHLYFTYSYIMYILNSLMYVMFTFSFIWGKPNTKSL